LATDFDEASIERPEEPELRDSGSTFHLIAGRAGRRITVRDHGLFEVDMRKLVSRLQAQAREAGADFVSGVSVSGVVGRTVATSSGDVEAGAVIDASGLSGARLLGAPRVHGRDLCSAAQHVYRVRDVPASRAFLDEIGVAERDVACFTGIAGGYSILNVRVHGDTISILTGSISHGGHPSGTRILDEFCARHSWIGERIFGGARAIPIRRPFDRIASGSVCAIGDAASQVFPAHGSGIGAGMVAAKYAADALETGAGLLDYASTWQRDKGPMFAVFDLFRRFSQTLSVDDLEWLMKSGVMDVESVRSGMSQALPRPQGLSLATKSASLLRRPKLALGIAQLAVKASLARALYRSYPRDPHKLPAFSKRIAMVFGDTPDESAHGSLGAR